MVEIVQGVTQPVCVRPAACKASPTPSVTEGRNAQRDSGKRRLSDVDVRQAAFILTEGQTVTQSILPLRLSPIQCFSLFSSFTLEVFCYSALKRHFKKKEKKYSWHSRSVERSWLHAARQRSTKPSDWKSKGMMCVSSPTFQQFPPHKKDSKGLNKNLPFLGSAKKEPSYSPPPHQPPPHPTNCLQATVSE